MCFEGQRNTKRRALFEAQDEIDAKRKLLIAEIEGKLQRSSVNFVHNNAEGSSSVLRNMTIEELQQERLDKETMRKVS